MTALPHWLRSLGELGAVLPEGLVPVDYTGPSLLPEQQAFLERAKHYGARYVFFQASGALQTEPIALVYVDDGLEDKAFAQLHRQLWSWGAVPLVYRKVLGRVDLLRCAHEPEFQTASGRLRYRPFQRLELAARISEDLEAVRWWDAASLGTGSLWDDAEIAEQLIHKGKAAHVSLLREVEALLVKVRKLPWSVLAERLLVMTLLIGYLEDRGALEDGIFDGTAGAALEPGPTGTRLFAVLQSGDADAVIRVFERLAEKFNGDVFRLDEAQQAAIHATDLGPFARIVGGREDSKGQLSLWRRYTFKDLPVELISRIYELFIDEKSAVYTPPFLARVLVAEVLDAQRCERVLTKGEVILDPACGSGVFLVEAYRRLVLHWRVENRWARPDISTLRSLLAHVWGVDKHGGAVELTVFSLCLALCDALDDDTLRASRKLFPPLKDKQLHPSCFFDWLDHKAPEMRVGVVLGNPPFDSQLTTGGAVKHAVHFKEQVGVEVPDHQLGYLFLQRSLVHLTEGGRLGMLQPPGLLYAENAQSMRAHLFARWDLREAIDLVKIHRLFPDADTKTVCVIFEGQPPPGDRRILHITPTRTDRVVARQGLDIDYYDLHWLDRGDDLADPVTWRSGLLGGRRTLKFARRLQMLQSLGQWIASRRWLRPSEGYIRGGKGKDRGKSGHLPGKILVPPHALVGDHLDHSLLEIVPEGPIEEPRTKENFTAPLLLIRKNQSLEHALLEVGYWAFKEETVGITAPSQDLDALRTLDAWLRVNKAALRGFAHATCPRLFVQRGTSHSQHTLLSLPMPEDGNLSLSDNERLVIDDIIGPYSELARIPQQTTALRKTPDTLLTAFAQVYARQVSLLYPKLNPLPPQRWSGLICQPFGFGEVEVDWLGADMLKDRLAALIRTEHSPGMHMRRIVRLYDGPFIFMLKPDVQRFWLKSVALWDADETLADLTEPGA